MKNSILFIFVTLLLCACGESKEEKADILIKKYLLQELYNYDSYSLIESKLEKAYNTPLNDSICRKCATNIVQMRKSYQDAMQVFKAQMIDVGLFTNDKGTQGYLKEDLKRYPEISQTHKMIEAIDAALSHEISQLKFNKPVDDEKHIGYSVNHKFRYRDSFGNPVIGDYYFLLDKKLENIIYVIDFENEASKSMIDVLDQFCAK